METKELLKKIRKDLNIDQKDLASEGLDRTVISKIESGSRKIDYIKARKIAERALEIQKEKNIILDYEINTDLILGIVRIDTKKILTDLQKGINNITLRNLKIALSKMMDREYVDLAIKAVAILENDLYKYSNLIVMYVMEILKHKITVEQSIDMQFLLARAYYSQGNFQNIVQLGYTFVDELKKFGDEEKQLRFYGNLATANFIEKDYEEALRILRLMKQFKNKKYEFKVLTLEANIELTRKNYEMAKKVYTKMIRISKDINIIANSYSNISWIYYEQKKYKLAKKYIDIAYDCFYELSTQFKYNILDNKLDIYLSLNQHNDIKNIFEEFLIIFKEFHNETEQNKIFDKIFDYYKESRNDSLLILDKINENKIKINEKLLIKIIKMHCNDDDLRKRFN